ncbi:CRTAC1 family protein [Spirosoma aureum]|uniref:CRTAC1 family protein n=1 Tax=Spirosoma aureum TaxID=2692134 RepID=A0A6G9AYQ0_9BACT|nr:CRTAC1 family protein [Spirosoma aureum]QIP17323.1 CRTAC1 family protein [Spirosoma aureum]
MVYFSWYQIRWLVIGLVGLFGSCTSKEKLFVQRKSSETGITFANRLTENDSVNVLSFEYMYNGAGVGVGDFNKDGLVDVYFAGNQVSSRLYLNQGDFHFKDITQPSGTGTTVWCTGVSVADVNQDGWPDIYVSVAGPTKDTTQRTNKLFINNGLQANGTPTFTERAADYGLNDTGYSTQAAFFDYDRDGDLDCYLLTNALETTNRNTLRPKQLDGEAPSTDRLYRNDGRTPGEKSPHFVNVSRETGILAEGYGLGVCVSDLDDNGWPDVYCANDFLSNDLVWLNKPETGKPNFSNQAATLLKHQTHNGMGVDIADINNDALPDIVVLDMLPPDNYRQKMMLPGSNYNRFQMEQALGYQPQYMRNTLQLNRGISQTNGQSTVSFSEIGQLAGIEKTDWSWAPLLADLDNDGWKDLYITNGYRRDVTNLDFIVFNHEQASFGTPEAQWKQTKDELYRLPDVKVSKYAYRNQGGNPAASLTFEDVSDAWGLNQLGYSNGAAYADFDNDGDLDLITNNIDDEAFVLENRLNQHSYEKGKEHHWLRLTIAPAPGLPVTIGTKVWLYTDGQMQMQELSPVRGFVSTVENVIHFGLGAASRFDSLVIRYPNGQKQILRQSATDRMLSISYKPEGEWTSPATARPPLFTELTAQQSGLIAAHQENSVVDFNRTPLLPHQYSKNGPCLAVADVNGDHLDDFFMGNDYGKLSNIYMQQVNGQFITATLPGSDAFEDMGAAFFDADADGDLDLYVVSGGSREEGLSVAYQDRLYLNDGAARPTFRPAPPSALPTTRSSGACVTVGDFDGDGDLDLFRGGRIIPGQYPKPADSYLLRNEGSKSAGPKFTDVTDLLAPGLRQVGLVTAALWTDTDNDHRADLMLVGEWMAPTLFHNEGGRLRMRKIDGLDQASGWWCSLLAKDFDGDGDMDFVAGNLGLNCKFRASPTEPVRVFADDFDHNGRLDPILTFYLNHEHVPVAQRDVLMVQIPSIKKRFPTFHDYASHPFEDLFTEDERKSAYVREAQQMASCYIENKGKAGFVVHQLPIEAQMAPIYGIQSGDFTGDGRLDLLLVGNFYGAETIGGQHDAGKGLLLSGDGAGHFRTVSNTGLVIDKDAKAVVPLRRKDGSVWWLVANNNGPLQVWQHSQVQ